MRTLGADGTPRDDAADAFGVYFIYFICICCIYLFVHFQPGVNPEQKKAQKQPDRKSVV